MSEMKFTPGPWTADVFNDDGVWIIASGESFVCYVQPYMPKPDDEINANAALIAAAPAMHKALDEAPVMRLGIDAPEQFIERYKEWYRTLRHDALSQSTPERKV